MTRHRPTGPCFPCTPEKSSPLIVRMSQWQHNIGQQSTAGRQLVSCNETRSQQSFLLSCSQACPTIVASPTNAQIHQGVTQHINLFLECADASIDNTLADPPDCPKAPCPSSSSSTNDGLTAFPLACLSRNQQSSNVLSSHRGAHGHSRDLMTSPGPCKSKTAGPTSRALVGKELRSWRDSKMQPAASSQLLPLSSEGASQGRGSEGCHRIRAAQDKLSNPACQPARAVFRGERQRKLQTSI